jgi:CO/xanthine dehydrogenase Mo-binding subunit
LQVASESHEVNKFYFIFIAARFNLIAGAAKSKSRSCDSSGVEQIKREMELMEQWRKQQWSLTADARPGRGRTAKIYRFAGEPAALTASAALAASAPAACFSASTLTRCRMRFSSSRCALRQ